ncbi:nucleotide-diphospho-sugar transferase [Dipodascopsis uninucleata]
MGHPGQTRSKQHAVVLALGVLTLLYLFAKSQSSVTVSSGSKSVIEGSLVGSDTELKLYRQSTRFPKQIWQTWKYAPSDVRFSAKLLRTTKTWRSLNGEYIHEILDDDMASSLVHQFYAAIPEVIEAYVSMPKPILRADFFRYLILLARGGVYSDVDTIALKNVDEWLALGMSDAGLVVGIEADPDRPDWHDWYARRVQFCQWTIYAKKGHPVLAHIVSHITTETLRRKATGKLELARTKESGSQIMDWTGPGIWTDTIFNYLEGTTWKDITGLQKGMLVKDVILLPITSFSPGVGAMGAHQPDHPHALVQHTFEGSWKPEDERHVG